MINAMNSGEATPETAIFHAAVHGWYEGHIQGEDACPGCDFRGGLPKQQGPGMPVDLISLDSAADTIAGERAEEEDRCGLRAGVDRHVASAPGCQRPRCRSPTRSG